MDLLHQFKFPSSIPRTLELKDTLCNEKVNIDIESDAVEDNIVV